MTCACRHCSPGESRKSKTSLRSSCADKLFDLDETQVGKRSVEVFDVDETQVARRSVWLYALGEREAAYQQRLWLESCKVRKPLLLLMPDIFPISGSPQNSVRFPFGRLRRGDYNRRKKEFKVITKAKFQSWKPKMLHQQQHA